MTAFIVIVHVIVCFVLILVILLQAGRGSGLSWGSFGGSPQSFLGTKSANFLAKATSVCAIIFLFTCILLNFFESKRSRSLYAGKGSSASQVDLDKVKKALEQVKSEGAQTQSEPATQAAQVQGAAEAPTIPKP